MQWGNDTLHTGTEISTLFSGEILHPPYCSQMRKALFTVSLVNWIDSELVLYIVTVNIVDWFSISSYFLTLLKFLNRLQLLVVLCSRWILAQYGKHYICFASELNRSLFCTISTVYVVHRFSICSYFPHFLNFRADYCCV